VVGESQWKKIFDHVFGTGIAATISGLSDIGVRFGCRF
jgi:hypothetical protein